MKRLLSMLLAVLMVMSLSVTAVYAEDTATDNSDALPFTDVKDGKWYTDAVKYVYANGLMNGMTATTFVPKGELTRAQFAKMLWSLAGSPATEPNLKFADTKNNKWYSESLTWAVNAGIVNGYNEGGKLLFKPDNKITRDELAKMIVTFLEYMDVEIVGENVPESFTDAAKFQKWAKPYIDAVRLSGLMEGKEGGKFDPKANATRAEGAIILMRMHPSLAPDKILQKMADEFIDTYQCLHGDIHFICGASATMTNEAIAAALAKFLNLDTEKTTLTVTEGKIEVEGNGRGQTEGGNLTFTLTDTETGASVSFTTGVACHKYFDIGTEGDYYKHFAPDPIYFVPVACHEDIDDEASAATAAAGLENLPTEYVVESLTEKEIWKAIDSAINFADKYYYETILVKSEIDALIASAVDGVATGTITVAIDRMTKHDRGCGASVQLNVTIKDNSGEILQEMADEFIDTYQCLHGDINFICNYGGSMTNEAIAAALATYMDLDSKGITVAVTAGEINKTGCGRTQGEGGKLTFTFTNVATGATASFTTGVTCHKYYDIGVESDGTIRYFCPDPIYFVPVACHEDIDNAESAEVAAAGLANLPTEYIVDEFSYKAIWDAIDAAIDFEDKLYYETILNQAELDALIASAVGGTATGTVTVALDRLTKAGCGCGASVQIEVTVTTNAVVALQQMADDFIDTYQCLHGDIHLICAAGGSMTNDAIAAAVAKYLELDSKGITLAVTAGEINKSGCGRGQAEGGKLTFTLTDTATGATASFDTGVTCHKYYDIGTEGDYYKHFQPDPIYFVPVACHEDIDDEASAATAAAGLENLPTEYVVESLTEKEIWKAIDSAINFADKYYYETILVKSEIDALIASAVDGVATGTITVAIDRMTKHDCGCGASVQIEVTVSTATNN